MRWIHFGKTMLLSLGLLVSTLEVKAEYRAYLLEVYDNVFHTRWEQETGFSPDKYILTHGGADRMSVLIKATWHCYGHTGGYRPICLMPAPHLPTFAVGDRVRVALEKHVTHGWQGTVEVALWRQDLGSNVYGVRFDDKRRLYARYFERNLTAITDTPQNVSAPQQSTPVNIGN